MQDNFLPSSHLLTYLYFPLPASTHFPLSKNYTAPTPCSCVRLTFPYTPTISSGLAKT